MLFVWFRFFFVTFRKSPCAPGRGGISDVCAFCVAELLCHKWDSHCGSFGVWLQGPRAWLGDLPDSDEWLLVTISGMWIFILSSSSIVIFVKLKEAVSGGRPMVNCLPKIILYHSFFIGIWSFILFYFVWSTKVFKVIHLFLYGSLSTMMLYLSIIHIYI